MELVEGLGCAMAGGRGFGCNAVRFGLVRADVVTGAVCRFVGSFAVLVGFMGYVGKKSISHHYAEGKDSGCNEKKGEKG